MQRKVDGRGTGFADLTKAYQTHCPNIRGVMKGGEGGA